MFLKAIRVRALSSSYRALAFTSQNDVTFTSVWQKARLARRELVRMAQQQPWSSYYYKLDAKLKARYVEKISLIKQEDPYTLKKTDFCPDLALLPSRVS